MTAEKPEGDVARIAALLNARATYCQLTIDDDPGSDIDTALELSRDVMREAANLLESQATRIATLTEALELIAEASYLDGACLIARRALGQGEAK